MSSSRLRVDLRIASDTSYLQPQAQFNTEVTDSPAEHLQSIQTASAEVTAGSGGVTVELGNFTTIDCLVIENQSASVAAIAHFHSLLGSQANPGTTGDPPHGYDLAEDDTPETITDNKSGGTFTTNGGVAFGYVRIASAEESANDGAYRIDSIDAAGNVITLDDEAALTTDNASDETATLQFEALNHEPIGFGETAIFYNVVAAGDLRIAGQGGTVVCRVIVYGD